MISNGSELMNLVNTLLLAEGYIKKNDTWYKNSEDCITFLSMGKSPYGGRYEQTFGFFLKDLNETGEEYPVFYKCDLKIELGYFVDSDFVKRVLNLEVKEFPGTEREFIISEWFDLYIIPFLRDVSSKNGIKHAITKYSDLLYYMDADAIMHLGLEIPE